MNGERVTNLEALQCAATLKMSVVVPKSFCWNRPRPAAFMIHQPGIVLLSLFKEGMFIYQKPKTK